MSCFYEPINPTAFDLKVINRGNSVQGYDLTLEPPQYWQANFETDSAVSNDGVDSGLLGESGESDFKIVVYPPVSLISAGTIVELKCTWNDPKKVSKKIIKQMQNYKKNTTKTCMICFLKVNLSPSKTFINCFPSIIHPFECETHLHFLKKFSKYK